MNARDDGPRCLHPARKRWPRLVAGLRGIGLGLLLAAQRGWRKGAPNGLRQHAMLAATALISVALLWSLYGLRFHAGADGSDAYNRPMADKIADLKLPH